MLLLLEPPAMISKPMMDISVPEKEKVTLECEVSRTNAEVKWFKVKNKNKKKSTVLIKTSKL